MAVSKRLRYEILRRDGHACRYCGAGAEERPLTVDHVLPVALGGADTADNLVAACRDCNAGKAASAPSAPLVDSVSDDALRWAAAVREAAAIMEADQEVRAQWANAFLAHWNNWTFDDEPAPLPVDWRPSVDRFRTLGLPWSEMAEAIDVAIVARGVRFENRFTYFAGVCWRKVEELQSAARSLIDLEGQA